MSRNTVVLEIDREIFSPNERMASTYICADLKGFDKPLPEGKKMGELPFSVMRDLTGAK